MKPERRRLTIDEWNALVASGKVEDVSSQMPAGFLVAYQTMRALIIYEGRVWHAAGWSFHKNAYVLLQETKAYDIVGPCQVALHRDNAQAKAAGQGGDCE